MSKRMKDGVEWYGAKQSGGEMEKGGGEWEKELKT